MHEARLYERSCFATFTYKEAPFGTSLKYTDFQLFMHRLRKSLRRPVRFFVAGEYGGQTWRPHFHAALFGYWPDDSVYYRKSPAGNRLYRSDKLDALWKHGLCAIGTLDYSSAAYIARYSIKKITGDAARDHYCKVDPATGEVFNLVSEFAHMSLKPGLGAGFLDRYMTDVFPRDYVVMNGRKVPVPKYYRSILSRKDILMSSGLESERFHATQTDGFRENSSPERLKVRSDCVRGRLQFYKRELE